MPFELAIALRYLKTRKHGFFALVTTLIAIGGVTLGVASLIITLSVMNGFRTDIQDKTLGIQPHIVLLGTEKESEISLAALTDKISAAKDVKAEAPFILGQILLKTSHRAQGAVCRGIIPEQEFKVTNAERTLISGSWKDLEPPQPEAPADKVLLRKNEMPKKAIVIGNELARSLGAGTGDEILLVSPTESAAVGVMGSVPKMEKYTVAGIFQSGMYEFDANMVFLSLANARELFGMTGATGIGIQTADLDKAEAVAKKVGELAGTDYWARSWQEMNRNLFEALKLEKIVMTLILTMIILVASFTIISNLILLSIEKARDIGILRALGSSRASIQKIFLYAGMVLGFTGTIIGCAAGIGISIALDRGHWIKLPQDVYYLDTLPIQILPGDVCIVLLAAFLITVLSAVIPASRAARINPVEAIRYG